MFRASGGPPRKKRHVDCVDVCAYNLKALFHAMEQFVFFYPIVPDRLQELQIG